MQAVAPDLTAFPRALLSKPNWVCWRYQESGGKRTKVPYAPNGRSMAKSNDPSTWGALEAARQTLIQGRADGIGFMFDETMFGVDLDHCIDPETGEVSPEAAAIVRQIPSYAEYSVSGTGLHILCLGALPTQEGRGKRHGLVEIYGKGRYFVVTGKPFGGNALPLRECTEEIKPLLAQIEASRKKPDSPPARAKKPVHLPSDALEDGDLLKRMFANAKSGPTVKALYEGGNLTYTSASEADLALCNHLAFWTDRDAARMDRLFRASGRMRSKWDEVHDGAHTYGHMTIEKAIEHTPEGYSADYGKKKRSEQARAHREEYEAHKSAAPAEGAAGLQQGAESAQPVPGGDLRQYYHELYTRTFSYASDGGRTYAVGKDDTKELASFTCAPVEEITRDDGAETRKEFVMEGVNAYGQRLRPCVVSAERFAAMSWVMEHWGFGANILPGQTVKDRLRHAIAEVGRFSAAPRTIYTHTGWRRIGGAWVYLYQGGAIGAQGVSVELEGKLSRLYCFTRAEHDPPAAMRASLGLLSALPGHIAFPLLCTMYLAPLREWFRSNPPAHVLFLYGGTGTGKSTAAALFLTHFSDQASAKGAAASFEETANALRLKAFWTKDAPFLVDDFHPVGSIKERKDMSDKAQALSRSFGDNAERGRMTADGRLRKERPPRGLGMISGEDLPDIGQSGSARYFVVEVKAGDVLGCPELNSLQLAGRQGLYARAMMGFIDWLRGQAEALPEALEAAFAEYRTMARARLGAAHGRAVDAVAHLSCALRMMCKCWMEAGVLAPQEAQALFQRGTAAFLATATAQTRDALEEDPVDLFLSCLRELVITGQARIADPADIEGGGFTLAQACGLMDEQYVYLLPGQAYGAVCEHLRKQGGRAFPVGSQTLGKRMKERGMLLPDPRGNPARNKRLAGKVCRAWWLRREVWEQSDQQMRMEEVLHA